MVSVLACVTWDVCLHEWQAWRAIMSAIIVIIVLEAIS